MKTLDLSELARLPDALKSGEEIRLVDGDKPVANVTPVASTHAGRWRPGVGGVPDWFLEELPPKFPESALEQLLHDRRSRDW